MPSPEHIVPSWDLQTLWVSGDISYRGGHGGVDADRPEDRQARQGDRRARFLQHLFHPRRQIGDRRRRGDAAARIPRSRTRWSCRVTSTTPQCAGINHADFSPDGSYAIFTCEFNDSLAKIDLVHHTLVETLPLTPGHMPQDIRVAPDGKVFFVADMHRRRRLVVIDGNSFGQVGFIPTGVGAHGLYPSRDGTKLYVSNRGTHNLAGAQEWPGQRLGDRLRHPQGRRQLDDSRRRQPGHGQLERRRQMAVALGPLRRRRSTPSTPTTAR